MARHFYIVLFLVILASPSEAWAREARSQSASLVESLEAAWDKEGERPAQPPVAGVDIEKIEEVHQNEATGNRLILQVFYPQGTGNENVDRQIKGFAERAAASYRLDAAEFLHEDPQSPGSGLLSRTFALTRPSAKYISIIFFESTYLGGAHPNRSYDILSYDLENGQALIVDDLFPKGDNDEQNRALGFLANYANAVLDNTCLAAYKDLFCLPNKVTADSISHSIRNFALTPEGLAVIYGPYDQGSYAEGSKYLDVPKKELLSWGARDVFWR